MSKTIIYQLLPRLFGNLNRGCQPNGSIHDNGCGKFDDINEIALQKLKNLGFSHVWYTGILEHASTTNYAQLPNRQFNANIVKGKAGSPYAISDYYDVCADLANVVSHRMEEFEALIERTHRAGLKCLIDFVPNHVARQYGSDVKPLGITDFGARDNHSVAFSAQNNFYYLPEESLRPPVDNLDVPYVEYPAKVSGNDAFTASPSINDWYETVKLNYGKDYQQGLECFDPIPDTWIKMNEILLFWAAKGVDGFRVDMAEMVPVAFWRWAITKIKQLYPELIFVAETYDLSQYRNYIKAGFDLLYDKEGFYNCLRSVMQGERKASDLCSVWQLNGDVDNHLLLFLENHDEQRLASSFFMGSGALAMPGVLVSALFNRRSALMIYFGQEVGEAGMDAEGFSGCDGRTTIFDYWGIALWQQFVNGHRYDGAHLPNENQLLYRWYCHLLQAIGQHQALQTGYFYDLTWFQTHPEQYNHASVYSFLRYDAQERFLVVANFGDENEIISLRIPSDVLESMRVDLEQVIIGTDIFTKERVLEGEAHRLPSDGLVMHLAPKSCLLVHL